MFRKKVQNVETERSREARVEMVVNKQTAKSAANNAKKSNARLIKTVEENHFTLSIFRAAGGTIKEKVAHSGH